MEAPKKPLYKSLYFQVICAILLGIALGHFYPQTAQAMKPLGDGFIKLIKMIIAPIIFCTVVLGVAGMEDMKKLGRIGGKALNSKTVMLAPQSSQTIALSSAVSKGETLTVNNINDYGADVAVKVTVK